MRRKLLFFLGFAVLLAALYFWFTGDFDTALFFETFSNIRPVWIVTSILVTFLGYIMRAFRWQILLISLKPIRLAPLVSATVLGFSAIYALGRAGEFVRPVWIARREEISITGSFAAILLERVFDMLMILLLFAISLVLVQLPIDAEDSIALLARAAWLLLMISVVALGSSVLFQKYVGIVAERIRLERLRKFLEMFGEGLRSTSNVRDLGLVSLYSLLLWFGIALQFWLMLVGLNFDFTFPATTLILVGSAIGSIAQVPGIGGGFQAGFIFSVTSFFLVPVETAIAASLIAWFVTYVPTMVVAAIYMMWKGISTHELVAEEPA